MAMPIFKLGDGVNFSESDWKRMEMEYANTPLNPTWLKTLREKAEEDKDKDKAGESSEKAKNRAIENSKIALDFYNKANHSNFEFLELKGWCTQEDGHSCWTHLNFLAKENIQDPYRLFQCPMFFFAELELLLEPRVVSCSVLETLFDTGNKMGCGFCHPEIRHPAHGVRAGQGSYQRRYPALGGGVFY